MFELLEDRSLLTANMLDPTFGSGGLVTSDLPFPVLAATNVVTQPDGKLIVAGNSNLDGGVNLARYNIDGTLDTSFGSEGLIQIDRDLLPMPVSSIALQADGRLLVAGTIHIINNDVDMAVIRLHPDGTLDRTFDGDGKKLIDLGSSRDLAKGVGVSPTGKIVVSGTTDFGGVGADLAIVQLHSDGSFDDSFGVNGKRLLDLGTVSDFTVGHVIQDDGKIVLAAEVSSYGLSADENTDFIVVRLDESGDLDTSFDVDGQQTVDFGSKDDFATHIAIQPDGKLLVAGRTHAYTLVYDGIFFIHQPVTSEMAIARLNSDGSLDNSFDADGRQTLNFGSTFSFLNDILVQPGGKLVVAGASLQGDSVRLSVARLTSFGAMDLSFDADGMTVIDLGIDSTEGAAACAVQPDGRILVIGGSSSPGTDLVIARLLADLDPNGEGDGIADVVDTQPTVFSNDFTDGTTSGTIISCGDQFITITDAPNSADGVLIAAEPSGGATPATISLEGGASNLSLTAGDQVVVTRGSVILDVLAGTVEAAFVADNGQVATASLSPGTTLEFEPETFSFIAPATNPEPVQVVVEGTEVIVPPGETIVAVRNITVDIQPNLLNVDSNGTLTVVVYGAIDFNVAQINVSSVRFAGAFASQSKYADLNRDGRLDLQLTFRRQDTILDEIYADLLLDDKNADGILDSTRQVAEVQVTGKTLDDDLFSGSDSINLFLSGLALRNLLDELFV